jgi:acyl dehydratase
MIDPGIVGTELGTVRFPLDRSKLAELARAFGDPDPVWHDADAAREAGFDGIPVLPTTTVIADHWREGGAIAMVDAIGADLRRILHGEAAWEFLAPMRAGAELAATQRVEDITTREGKRGGQMTLVTLVTDYADAGGEVVARRRDTLIEKGA